jgi:hypothetical protein
VTTVLALTTDGAKNIGLIAIVVFLGFSLVSMLVVKAVVGKVIGVVVFAGIALLLAGQRSSISSCADNVRSTAVTSPGRLTKTTCRFFGVDVHVPTG